MRRLLVTLVVLSLVPLGVSESPRTNQHQLEQRTLDLLLACALTTAGSTVMGCSCMLDLGSGCACGTCCDNWKRDRCYYARWYEEHPDYPRECYAFSCGAYSRYCYECDCDVIIGDIGPSSHRAHQLS